MRAITIIKRSERRPVSVQSETLVKQPELASDTDERALIKTVESWVIERRESASIGHRQAVYLLSNAVEPQVSADDEAERIAAAVLSGRASLLQSTLRVKRSS